MTRPTLDELIEDLDKIDIEDVDAYHVAFSRMHALYPAAGEEIRQRLQARSDQAHDGMVRALAAAWIDPATAEVHWEYGQVLDPYGINPDLPMECQQVGRVYFARSPGSDIWVCFYDLPEATREALWERHKQKLAFPAGLPFLRESL